MKANKAIGVGLMAMLVLAIAMVPAVSADIYAYECDEGLVVFEIKEKTPLQKLFPLLSFTGVSSFNVGSGVDTTASPWVVTGKKTTFDVGEPIYALVVLHNVEESVEIAIRMQNSYGTDVLGFTHTIPDPGTAYYPWYAVYPYPPIDDKPSGGYTFMVDIDYSTKHWKNIVISGAPTPTPSPTPDPICTPNIETRCNGNNLEKCNSQGTGWTFVRACDWGCTCSPLPCHCEVEPTPTPTPTASPTPTPTPDPGTCTPGEERCFDDYLKTCNPAGDGWDETKTELCGWGCDAEKDECAKLLPGFEMVFAILGLLTVAYFVQRRKEK